MRKRIWLTTGVVPMAAVAAWVAFHHPRQSQPPRVVEPPVVVTPAPVADAEAAQAKMDPNDESHDDERSYVFRIPSGEPTALSCEEARTIVDQVRAGLAYPPDGVPSAPFATSAADWLDPHGLLSLA